MSNYVCAVKSEKTAKFKNTNEILDIVLALGYDESFIEDDGSVFVGGFDHPLDEFDSVVIDKSNDKVVGVSVAGDFYQDFDGYEIEFDSNLYEEVPAFEYLQSQLLDGEVLAMVEAGWEKLRSVSGTVVVISQDKIVWKSTYNLIDEIIKESEVKNENV